MTLWLYVLGASWARIAPKVWLVMLVLLALLALRLIWDVSGNAVCILFDCP